jgi:glutathione S-transferase
MPEIELISDRVCPFAQRTRLALMEKGVPFNLTEIDVTAKPDWFLEISPYEKVPVLKVDGDVVWESAVINEYLEEVFPEPPLLPREPYRRAIARVWIDFANVTFVPLFYKLLLEQDRERRCKLADRMRDKLLFMETEGLAKTGGGEPGSPYWFGAAPGLVDLTFYPFFERWPAIVHYRGIEIPGECARLRHWLEAMRGRESVRAIANSAEYYIRHYAAYAHDTASGVTAEEMREA